jgi:histone H3/H4
MAISGPLRVTTLKKYMKAQTELRVDADAVEHLAEQVNARLQRVVDRAAVLAEMQGRSTVLLRDVERAIEDVGKDGGTTGPPERTPEEVFAILEGYDIDQLSALARQLEASLGD